ncbi:hypothetical protein FPV67DRAFT_1452524 [Lyophyllum atratum]|nr:hypothetical protein FPV67DRAFT_1452524 [Lyophyllum atratum]
MFRVARERLTLFEKLCSSRRDADQRIVRFLFSASLYQNAYHAILAGSFHDKWPGLHPHPPPGPQEHELKKQYLALLPPQQIIEICLNFDLHVPPYVKSSIWPPDINAAIAAMRKTSPQTTDPPAASTSTAPPAMGSLTDLSDPTSTADTSIEQPGEAQPPDKPSPTTDTSASAQTSAQPSPAPPEHPTPAPPQQPPYPHQPYGYGHPQAAYPHAPYYQHPPGYPPYPSPYGYSQMPGAYPPPPPAPPPHPGYPQQPAPPFTTAPLTHPPQQPQDTFNPAMNTSTEDLPSYEEMIVEALSDSGDPEGCAPKDLFTWMASRYPLQSNFRPSASQALQKAFKRGRFLKSSSGKYKLNATWEGGNTSRRTTRRPQTQNPTAAGAAPASPFTHAPLVHHHQQPAQNQPYQPPGFGFSFQQPQGYPGFQQQPQAPAQTAQPSSAAAAASTSATGPLQTEGAVHDAWEAAQNILKAINFDSLLQLPVEDEKAREQDNAVAGPSTVASTALPVTATAGLDLFSGAVPGEIDVSAESSMAYYAAGRAELQAQLALLAAQLAELSQEDDADPVVHYPVVESHEPPVTAPTINPPTVAASGPPPIGSFPSQFGLALPGPGNPTLTGQPHPPIVAAPEEEEDSEDDDDMEEVI